MGLGRAGRDWPPSVRDVEPGRLRDEEPDVVVLQRPEEIEECRAAARPPPGTGHSRGVSGTQHPQGRCAQLAASAGRPAGHDGRACHPLQWLFWDCGTAPDHGDRARHRRPRQALHRRAGTAGRGGQRAGTPLAGHRDGPAAGFCTNGAAGSVRHGNRPAGRGHGAGPRPAARPRRPAEPPAARRAGPLPPLSAPAALDVAGPGAAGSHAPGHAGGGAGQHGGGPGRSAGSGGDLHGRGPAAPASGPPADGPGRGRGTRRRRARGRRCRTTGCRPSWTTGTACWPRPQHAPDGPWPPTRGESREDIDGFRTCQPAGRAGRGGRRRPKRARGGPLRSVGPARAQRERLHPPR